jgi:hypothetical protein
MLQKQEMVSCPVGRTFRLGQGCSVDDLIVVVVVLQLREDVVGVPAAEVTEAGVDPHHLPCQSGSVGTLELHLDSLGLVRDAAAIVCGHADTTVFWTVGLLAVAA